MRRLLWAVILLTLGTVSASAQYYMNVVQKDGIKVPFLLSNIDSVYFSVREIPENPVTNYEYVDLGLSVNWATFNVGATKPEEYGDYYAWGETEVKTDFGWDTYKFRTSGDSDYNVILSKYNTSSDHGTVDSKTILDPEDDVAHVKWGGNWRMPTKEEIDELHYNCTWTWYDSENSEFGGVAGYKVTSMKTGYSDRFIFLPAAGCRGDKRISGSESYGLYWSSSLEMDSPHDSWPIYFGTGDVVTFFCNLRSCGQSIRPVCSSEEWLSSVDIDYAEDNKTMLVGGNAVLNVVVKQNDKILNNPPIRWSTDNPLVANVNEDGIVTALSEGIAQITASIQSLSVQCTVSVIDESEFVIEYESVDLGLSVKWATFNVGALYPDDFGAYYAWGETESKAKYNWSTYKWSNGSYTSLTKYCNNSECGYNGYTDTQTTLDFEDDVAHVKWGGSWRVPTEAEFAELKNNCTWIWYSSGNSEFNGVAGYKVTSNKPGYTDRFIFLPAAGDRDGTSINGKYWSSSLCYSEPYYAHILLFYSYNQVYLNSYTMRNGGFPVRPVCPSEEWLSSISSISFVEDNKTMCVDGSVFLNVIIEQNDEILNNPPSTEWSSDDLSVAVVDENGIVTAISTGTVHITASIQSLSVQCTVNVINESESGIEYESVDLGLSVKWATFNVGALSPEDLGAYYAWGETESKAKYNWSTYKWSNGSYTSLTKYCNNSECGYNGYTDTQTTLDFEDDVAHVKWGGSWRVPTEAEFAELKNNCTWIWYSSGNSEFNGVAGYKVTSNKPGYTDRFIFLPATGHRSGKAITSSGLNGLYWCSSLYTDFPPDAMSLNIEPRYNALSFFERYYGLSVRPVCSVSSSEESTPDDNQNEITYGNLTIYKAKADSTDVTSFNIEARLKGLSTLEEGSYAVYFYYSDTSYTPSASNNGIRVKANLKGDSIASYALNGMNMCSTYYFRVAVATFEGDIYYGPVDGYVVKDLVTKGDKIDLGIPGIKFASCNLGATQPGQSGDRYAWGETQSKTSFSLGNYSYYNENVDIWKGLGDDISGTQYDAATAVLGEGWHMPNSEVMSKLSMCIIKSITYNGINGYLVIGPNSNAIFLPSGAYWTSFYSSDNEQRAKIWNSGIGESYRYSGCMIRPIFGQFEYPMEYVDLGLSVKWATCNVGAVMPQDYGAYYAWGETETKSNYDWSTYKWCNGSSSTFTKYCNNSNYGNEGFTDTLTVLTLEDDVAHVKWGGTWRMPTKAELDELRNNCTWTWTTLNGVNGYLVTSNKTGYTDRSIFLPAAGCRFDTDPNFVGYYGFYWSSSLNTDYPDRAWYVDFISGNVDWNSYYRRFNGLSVRPVCP